MIFQFQPENMEVEFNFSAMASVVSTSQESLEVIAHFRAYSDYIGLCYNSKDFRMHIDSRYPEKYDYEDTILSFAPVFKGEVAKYNDIIKLPSIDINYVDGSKRAVTLGFLSNKTQGSMSFTNWTSGVDLGSRWIAWNSERVYWEKEIVVGYRDIFDEEGNYIKTVEVKETKSGIGSRESDYVVDYVFGILSPVNNSGIPYGADISVSFKYGLHETYTIDFNNLLEGTHPNNATSASNKNIKKIVFPIIPSFYIEGENKLTGNSDEIKVNFNNWNVSGGILGESYVKRKSHTFRLAEGYDDEYYRNPLRLIKSMHNLGYRKVINLYIGASHYYDKSGNKGTSSLDHKTQVLIENRGVCAAAKNWVRYLCKAMKDYGFTELIMSVSMENLQMKSEWRQKIYNGEDGSTGWEPPTSFFSPTNGEVRVYYERICRELIDIMEEEEMPPILQLGEPWWWWQEFIPGNIQIPYSGRPPCFYDEATKLKFLNEKGKALPIYKNSNIKMTSDNREALLWLKDQLGDFSNFVKSIVKSYQGGKYTILFFPPSVLDIDRVPEAIRLVNVPKQQWDFPELDFIQIEDYDWVIHQNDRHPEIFDFAYRYFNYQPYKSHYFSGFAWSEYTTSTGLTIKKQWELIEKAAVMALSNNIEEVFIWAGTQIRRDSWVPDMPVKHLPNIINEIVLNIKQIEKE